jgi:hypothetical protein
LAALPAPIAVVLVVVVDALDAMAAAGEVAPEVGAAADLTGVGSRVVLDTGGVRAPVGESVGLVAVEAGGGVLTVVGAWSSAGAVD